MPGGCPTACVYHFGGRFETGAAAWPTARSWCFGGWFVRDGSGLLPDGSLAVDIIFAVAEDVVNKPLARVQGLDGRHLVVVVRQARDRRGGVGCGCRGGEGKRRF